MMRNICIRRMSSASFSEINKFSAMDESWWDPQKNPLISMNVVRVNYIKSMVQKYGRNQGDSTGGHKLNHHHLPLEHLKAVDVGCGGGLLSESLARLGADVTAIDPSERLVQVARERAKQQQSATNDSSSSYPFRPIHFVGGQTLEEWVAQQRQHHQEKTQASSTSSSFDLICILEVIEHIPTSRQAVSLFETACSLVCPHHGLLFVSTINRTWKSHFMTILGAEYIMGYLPIGTHNWNQYWSPEELARLAHETGWEQVDVCGMVVMPPKLHQIPSLLGRGSGGSWEWKLDPNDTDINWIGTYRKRQE